MKPMKRRDTLKAALGGLLLPTAMPGRGIDTGDYLFNGGTVWVDHGAGLLTMVCHLSRIDVQVGDQLAAGQPTALGAPPAPTCTGSAAQTRRRRRTVPRRRRWSCSWRLARQANPVVGQSKAAHHVYQRRLHPHDDRRRSVRSQHQLMRGAGHRHVE